jgi:L-lactate dehydrogenase complex protein LldE
MKIGLLIPCYVDLFYPEVGVATLELLEKLKVDVVYPFDQTCCGQPMANSGCYEEAQATEELFIKNFCAFDHIVTPSGSCTHYLRNSPMKAMPIFPPTYLKYHHPVYVALSSSAAKRRNAHHPGR